MIKKDFKQKYFLFCREKEFEIKKYSELLADVDKKTYICITEIKQIMELAYKEDLFFTLSATMDKDTAIKETEKIRINGVEYRMN